MRSLLASAPLLVVAACANPTISDATFAGDESECSATFSCADGGCGGHAYVITCTYNDTNANYDCSCTVDGVEGESFQEAGVCEQDADGKFSDFDLTDASDHAVDDCKFPLLGAAAEE